MRLAAPSCVTSVIFVWIFSASVRSLSSLSFTAISSASKAASLASSSTSMDRMRSACASASVSAPADIAAFRFSSSILRLPRTFDKVASLRSFVFVA